jgi:FAD/FMN-containing dehydrogenase
LRSISPRLALGLGLLLGMFRVAANAGDYLAFSPAFRFTMGIVGTAGTVGVAVWLGFVLSPRRDWVAAVFLNGAAVQAAAVLVRVGLRLALVPGVLPGAAAWAVLPVLALLSGVLLGAVLVGFAWALRRLDLVHPEPEDGRPDG